MPISLDDALKPVPSPITLAVKKFLDSRPADKLYTTIEVGKAVNCGVDSLTRACKELPEYCVVRAARHGRFWGNPRAIAALKKRLGEY